MKILIKYYESITQIKPKIINYFEFCQIVKTFKLEVDALIYQKTQTKIIFRDDLKLKQVEMLFIKEN